MFLSIIIPLDRLSPLLDSSLQRIEDARENGCEVEVIIVATMPVYDRAASRYPGENVVEAHKVGRGYQCVQGAELSRGDVILFLHGDTILPEVFHEAIAKALSDKTVAGGAFSLRFDAPHPWLTILLTLSEWRSRLLREIWGDRAMFVRRSVFETCASVMRVPLMEDVRLSTCMGKQGRVALLEQAVVTSAERFMRDGLWRHTMRIIFCRLWYTFGVRPELIYKLYYPKTASSRKAFRDLSMKQKTAIMFVYNADSGFFSTLTDAVHKMLLPATYRCNLCKLTYGNLGMKQQWALFLKTLPYPAQFLHRDEFQETYPALKDTRLPAVFVVRGNEPSLALSADRINQARTIEDLAAMVNETIKTINSNTNQPGSHQ